MKQPLKIPPYLKKSILTCNFCLQAHPCRQGPEKFVKPNRNTPPPLHSYVFSFFRDQGEGPRGWLDDDNPILQMDKLLREGSL